VNATGVTAGPAESNGRLLLSKWCDSLHVTCGLTACTPGSAPGPTLGNEYGKTLPLLEDVFQLVAENNACIYSTIDMFSCYYQLFLNGASEPKTCFVTHSYLAINIPQFQWACKGHQVHLAT